MRLSLNTIRYIFRPLLRLEDALQDRWRRVDTRSLIARNYARADRSSFRDSVRYQPPSWRQVRWILSHLELKADDVFVDVGCGMGRILCSAAQHDLTHVMGVEIDPELADVARRNLNTMRGRRISAEVHCADAIDFDYAAATILFLFHPFGPRTMRAFLQTVERTNRGPNFRLAYLNPVQRLPLDEMPTLKLTRELRSPLFKHPTLVYHRTLELGTELDLECCYRES